MPSFERGFRKPSAPATEARSAPAEARHALLDVQRRAGNAAAVAMVSRKPTVATVEARGRPNLPPGLTYGDVEPASKVNHVKVPPSGTAIATLEPDYGLTWPETIDVELTAKKSGDEWVPVITKLTGNYSVQARLLPGPPAQQDIPNAGVATAGNFQALLDSLDQLGNGNHSHYSLAAVQSHEAEHANRVRLALENIEAELTEELEEVTTPIQQNDTAALAIARIQGDPRWATAVADGVQDWNDEFDRIIAGDHNGDGPCEKAEKRVTVPLRKAIHDRAVQAKWIAPPNQLNTGGGPNQVQNVKTNLGQQQAPVPKPQLQLPPKKQWPPPPGGND